MSVYVSGTVLGDGKKIVKNRVKKIPAFQELGFL